MYVLIGILAYTGMFLMVDESAGSELAITLAMSSVAVGSLAAATHYVTWIERSLWLLAFLMAIISLPGNLEASREIMPEMPARLRDIWLVIVILPVPVGVMVGALRTWIWMRT